ncbi:Carboxylesterase type B, conserved site,Carboxylesterase, type B,Alpha/Beta hydrolase fold [Cinara cedri]|uniref:Carboxylesterase type B, conserved site,Carboxylesterase, type B,Alpha/Beta hydrolase fold n=1 Tax=Cinara cedri TaxID=506608 RepID=A0A5E4M686_9HEMI|nr:Carboxylesterase type B, conserved site,Carboxylesterase, type B,Alpha/Beta hydrolase fold [Cinara cedri]
MARPNNCRRLWLTLLAVCVCGASAQRLVPSVKVRDQGTVSGDDVVLSKLGYRAWVYLGIPFAKPPVGDLRFEAPDADPPPAWTGVRNGSAHMPGCIQNPPAITQPIYRLFASMGATSGGQHKTSEDCLYLNIYRPEGFTPEEGFPVMVWFHPGNFQWGTPMHWDASVLAARHKVIVVTTAFRLNILGFYTDNTAVAPGNWGLMDQATALDWVRKNIDSFGGAPHNVTVFGQGSGAVSVGLHVVSPWSRDKFQRAISMSGNALMRTAVVSSSGSEEVLTKLADRFNCFLNTLTGCLKNVDADELVKVGTSLNINWGPVIDGPVLVNNSEGREPFLPDAPAEMMANGRFTAVPHLIGYNRMEDAYDAFAEDEDNGISGESITERTRKVREQFEALVRDITMDDFEDMQLRRRSQQPTVVPALADETSDGGSAAGGGNNYEDGNCTINADFVVDTLLMRYARQTDDPETLRRNYVIMAANKKYWATSYRVAAYVSRYNATYVYRYEYKLRVAKALLNAAEWMDAPNGAELPMVWGMPYWSTAVAGDWTAADRRMSDMAMFIWTNFAKYADPAYRNPVFNVKWDAFQPSNPRAMVLDKVLNMSAVDQEPEFWNDYYPKVVAVSMQCCYNYTVESAATPSAPHLGLRGNGWPSAVLLTVLLSLSHAASFSPIA